MSTSNEVDRGSVLDAITRSKRRLRLAELRLVEALEKAALIGGQAVEAIGRIRAEIDRERTIALNEDQHLRLRDAMSRYDECVETLRRDGIASAKALRDYREAFISLFNESADAWQIPKRLDGAVRICERSGLTR